MNITVKSFRNLTNNELYDILKLRVDIFVVEQKCPYNECDCLDKQAMHLTGRIKKKLVGYIRIIPPGIRFTESSLGRVAVSKEFRGINLGKELLTFCLEYMEKRYKTSIRISAQSYLIKFYENFGFRKVSDEYLEDNIPHVNMIRAEINSFMTME